ncbi:MAG: family 78 glycoside hydrolase catalytic domain [Clostridia bacterium]|nr:family 78 glycoside hydrolase catalytic domain [Clostridia bacterium]
MLLKSKWITYQTGEYKDLNEKYGNPSPYFRKSFVCPQKPTKATLQMSALGVWKAYINGQSVGDDYLSPGWVDYSKKLPLVSYDVTNLVKENNAIGVVLGDGWAVGHLGSNYTFKRNNYSDRIEFTAQLTLEYADGTSETVSTDNSWRATKGEILRSDLYMGEYIDHRLSLGNFSAWDYDDSSWDHAEEVVFKFSRNIFLEAVKIPPIRVMHRLEGKLIAQMGNTYLYDFEQNMAGVLHFFVKGTRGTKLTVRHGELLVDEKLYTENLRKAEATDTYILSGEGSEEFRPLFTYHGYRYAEITVEGEAELSGVATEVMYTDLPVAGEFRCSDPVVNRVYENALWGQRSNFMSVPTDCPQRDERLGWTADTQIFSLSAMYNMDCNAYYRKYLADIRDTQLGNGAIPSVAPMPHVGSFAYTGREVAAGWSEAPAVIAHYHYRMYGDKAVLRDTLPMLRRLLEYYAAESPDGIRSGEGAYGDWLSLGTPTDLGLVSTAYYAYACKLAMEFCEILHYREEAEEYSALFAFVKSAFRARFLTEEGRLTSDTQSAYLLGYQFGLLEREEAKPNLLRTLRRANNKLTTGFLGVKYLLPTLCEFGESDLAYEIITNREYPGWGYSVLNGATTIWEHWDSYTKDRGILGGMNSFNHYSLGSCTEWMYAYCLGIQPDDTEVGFRTKLNLHPYMDKTGRITVACGYYTAPAGRIYVEWERKPDGCYLYHADVPESIEVDFAFDGMKTLSKIAKDGHYTYLLRIEE